MTLAEEIRDLFICEGDESECLAEIQSILDKHKGEPVGKVLELDFDTMVGKFTINPDSRIGMESLYTSPCGCNAEKVYGMSNKENDKWVLSPYFSEDKEDMEKIIVEQAEANNKDVNDSRLETFSKLEEK